MALVDDHARIFGRFNLVDLLLAVVLLGLIPLGYGAYVLFKVPVPRLTGIEPPVVQVEPEFRVTIKGEHLRPYMRVSLNDMQGRGFFFKNVTTAEVVFGDIPPGQYDVVLYDYAQERDRLPKAMTVTPPALPAAQVHVAGFLTSVDESVVPQMKPGLVFPGQGEVVAIGAPGPDLARVMAGAATLDIPITQTVKIPMLLRVHCSVQAGSSGFGRCVSGQTLEPNIYLMVSALGRRLPFLITEVRPTTEPTLVDLRVRLAGDAPAIPLIRVDDVDVGYSQNEFSGGARVTAAPAGGREMALRVPAFPTLTGWVYAAQPLKVGGEILLVTTRYQVRGIVTAMPAPPVAP